MGDKTSKLARRHVLALKEVARATDRAGGLVVKRPSKSLLDLADRGLVQSGANETVRALKSGNVKMTLTPAFRMNDKGRAALAALGDGDG